MTHFFVFILIVILVSFLYIVFTYNHLKKLSINVDEGFSNIDIFLTKRYDQITSLIDTVNEFVQHEESLLTNLTKTRQQLNTNELSNDEKLKLHNDLTNDLSQFFVQVEDYPELKSSNNFIELQKSINQIEEELQAARRTYNAHVGDYNTAIAMFPSNIIASMFNFSGKEMFKGNHNKHNVVDIRQRFSK